MRLLQNIIKLYSSSIFKRTPWIASSCFSTPLQNHPRKDTHNTSTLSVFASHQAKQSRSYTWNTLKPMLFVFVFLLIGFSSFTTFTYAVPDDGNSNVGCPSGTVRTAKTKECVPNFIPLVGIPYIDNPKEIGSMADYVSALYKISISIAAFLAVIKIIFAGVKYMLSDVVTDKGAAKKDIRGALIGLLIVIGAVLILNTINPQLRNLNVLKGPGVQVGLGEGKPELSDIDKKCASFGKNNCKITSCATFDSPERALGWIGYLPMWWGADYVLNRTSCGAICTLRGGEVLNEFGTETASGQCVYPADRAAAIQQEMLDSSTQVVKDRRNISSSDLLKFKTDCNKKTGKWEEVGAYLLRCTYPPGESSIFTPSNEEIVWLQRIEEAISTKKSLDNTEGNPVVCAPDRRRSVCVNQCLEAGGSISDAAGGVVKVCTY